MKLLKVKLVIGVVSVFVVLFGVLFCVMLLFSDEEETSNNTDSINGVSVSAEVLAHKQTVEKYCKEFGISD